MWSWGEGEGLGVNVAPALVGSASLQPRPRPPEPRRGRSPSQPREVTEPAGLRTPAPGSLAPTGFHAMKENFFAKGKR